MAKFNDEIRCIQCGKCCLADMIACADEEDLKRWQAQNRMDILHIMENQCAVWAGDHLVSSADGRYLGACPFLGWQDKHTVCAIYDTKPRVCSEYKPGSSEICPGFKK